MPAQKKLTAFFSGGSRQKAADELAAPENLLPEPKRFKATNADENSTIGGSSLSVNPDEGTILTEKLNTQRLKTPLLDEKFGVTWFNALEREFEKPYFIALDAFVREERKKGVIYPTAENVFNWTRHFPIHETKVVILGQDPYHGPRQAHGLCFSVEHGCEIPPSLRNIYKELQSDIPGFRPPGHGNLTGWVNQGVLLLNAVLTVRAGNANSHKEKGWEQFTDAVIKWLSDNLHGVVFLLWGRYAQVKGQRIDKNRHHVLESAHPSPLSATKFFGCKHFSRANDILKKNGKSPVDWTAL